jgi:hypothetical protein
LREPLPSGDAGIIHEKTNRRERTMPFRDELQAAHDKIAALELRLRERQEPEANVDQLELLAILRKERQTAEAALAAEKSARQADRQAAQEEVARAREEVAMQLRRIAAKEEQEKMLRDAIDARNNSIQESLEARAKHLQETLESTNKNIERMQQTANEALENFATLSRSRALLSYQSQLSDLQLQIKNSEAKLIAPPAPSMPKNDLEAQIQQEIQQTMMRVERDLLSSMRKREAHLIKMCAILSQPPKE